MPKGERMGQGGGRDRTPESSEQFTRRAKEGLQQALANPETARAIEKVGKEIDELIQKINGLDEAESKAALSQYLESIGDSERMTALASQGNPFAQVRAFEATASVQEAVGKASNLMHLLEVPETLEQFPPHEHKHSQAMERYHVRGALDLTFAVGSGGAMYSGLYEFAKSVVGTNVTDSWVRGLMIVAAAGLAGTVYKGKSRVYDIARHTGKSIIGATTEAVKQSPSAAVLWTVAFMAGANAGAGAAIEGMILAENAVTTQRIGERTVEPVTQSVQGVVDVLQKYVGSTLPNLITGVVENERGGRSGQGLGGTGQEGAGPQYAGKYFALNGTLAPTGTAKPDVLEKLKKLRSDYGFAEGQSVPQFINDVYQHSGVPEAKRDLDAEIDLFIKEAQEMGSASWEKIFWDEMTYRPPNPTILQESAKRISAKVAVLKQKYDSMQARVSDVERYTAQAFTDIGAAGQGINLQFPRLGAIPVDEVNEFAEGKSAVQDTGVKFTWLTQQQWEKVKAFGTGPVDVETGTGKAMFITALLMFYSTLELGPVAAGLRNAAAEARKNAERLPPHIDEIKEAESRMCAMIADVVKALHSQGTMEFFGVPESSSSDVDELSVLVRLREMAQSEIPEFKARRGGRQKLFDRFNLVSDRAFRLFSDLNVLRHAPAEDVKDVTLYLEWLADKVESAKTPGGLAALTNSVVDGFLDMYRMTGKAETDTKRFIAELQSTRRPAHEVAEHLRLSELQLSAHTKMVQREAYQRALEDLPSDIPKSVRGQSDTFDPSTIAHRLDDDRPVNIKEFQSEYSHARGYIEAKLRILNTEIETLRQKGLIITTGPRRTAQSRAIDITTREDFKPLRGAIEKIKKDIKEQLGVSMGQHAAIERMTDIKRGPVKEILEKIRSNDRFAAYKPHADFIHDPELDKPVLRISVGPKEGNQIFAKVEYEPNMLDPELSTVEVVDSIRTWSDAALDELDRRTKAYEIHQSVRAR